MTHCLVERCLCWASPSSLIHNMAVDFLTIASSSAETEREDDHSIARSPKTLFVAKAQTAQCLRSWSSSKIGVYKPSLQFNLLDNENRRDVVDWLSSYVS